MMDSQDPNTFSPRGLRLLDYAGEAVLAVMLALLVTSFGGVEPWSELAALVLASLGLTLLAVRWLVAPGKAACPRLLWLAMAGFAGIVLLQLTPLPAPVLKVLAPGSAQVWATAETEGAKPGWGRISVAPSATWHSLRLMLIPLAAFCLVVFGQRAPGAASRLISVVVVLLLGQIALFWAQFATGADSIFGQVKTPVGPNGTFINHNNFAQWMGLATGLTLMATIARWRRGVAGSVVLLAGVVALTAATVAMSHSRSGVVAFGVASLVIAWPLIATRQVRPGIAIPFAVVGVLMLVAGVFAIETLIARFEGVIEQGDADIRWRITRHLFSLWPSIGILGWGQGTYELAWPSLRTLSVYKHMVHADADYAQLFAETGWAGMSCLGLLVLALMRLLWQGVRMVGRRGAAVTAGGVFALTIILLVSGVDFGQRLPGIAAFTAVVVGLLVRVAATHRVQVRRWQAGVAGALIVLAVGISMPAAWQHLVAQRHARAAQAMLQAQDNVRPAALAEAAAHLDQAVEAEPSNGQLVLRRAQLRWRRLWMQETRPGASIDREELVTVAEEAARARRLAPVLANAAVLEAEARRLLGEREAAARLVWAAAEIAPSDSLIAMRAGFEALSISDEMAARRFLRQAIDQHGRYFGPIADALLDQFNKPQLLLDLAEGNADRLKGVHQRLNKRGQSELASIAFERMVSARMADVQQGKADARSLAALGQNMAQLGRHEEAAQWYALAIDMAGGAASAQSNQWRIARAKALLASGQRSAAEAEVDRVLSLQPDHREASRIKAQIEKAF